MASNDLLPQRLKSGWDYLAALRRLGAEPEGLCWAQIVESGNPWEGEEFRLLLITSLIDEAGPLPLEEILFKAYNLAATPSEISPFIVEVISPKTPVARAIADGMRSQSSIRPWITTDEGEVLSLENGGLGPSDLWFQIGDLLLSPGWAYKVPEGARRWRDRGAQWRRFRRNVNQMAA